MQFFREKIINAYTILFSRHEKINPIMHKILTESQYSYQKNQ